MSAGRAGDLAADPDRSAGEGRAVGPDLAAMPPLDRAALRRDVERLAAIGPRFAGSAGEERGREFLLDELAAAGLASVREEPFPHLAYRPGGGDCRVLGSDLDLPCVGLQSTAAGAVEAEAIYVGPGDEAALAALEADAANADAEAGAGRATDAADPPTRSHLSPHSVDNCERTGGDGGGGRGRGPLAGKIVVVRAGVPAVVVPGLVERGAAGIVVLGQAPDGLINHFTANFYPPPLAPPWKRRVLPVPGLTVEAEAGERLLALLSAGPTRMRLEHRAEYATATSANLVGEITGEDPDASRLVIGAHHDTQLGSPGAADNGTGLAALLGIARAWSGLRPRRTIELVAFGAEEPASWGASHFVAARGGKGIAAMVNLDALGPPLRARRTIVADLSLAPFAAASARATGWEVEQELDARQFPYADHAPFVDAGIPACWIWRYPPPHPYYHTSGDTPRWVDYDLLAEDAAASAFTAFRLATLPESAWLPGGRPSPPS